MHNSEIFLRKPTYVILLSKTTSSLTISWTLILPFTCFDLYFDSGKNYGFKISLVSCWLSIIDNLAYRAMNKDNWR